MPARRRSSGTSPHAGQPPPERRRQSGRFGHWRRCNKADARSGARRRRSLGLDRPALIARNACRRLREHGETLRTLPLLLAGGGAEPAADVWRPAPLSESKDRPADISPMSLAVDELEPRQGLRRRPPRPRFGRPVTQRSADVRRHARRRAPVRLGQRAASLLDTRGEAGATLAANDAAPDVAKEASPDVRIRVSRLLLCGGGTVR